MTYEVMHGYRTEFIQAGNQYAACLEMLKIEAEDDQIETGPFDVTALPCGVSESVPMEEILKLRILASNPEKVPI